MNTLQATRCTQPVMLHVHAAFRVYIVGYTLFAPRLCATKFQKLSEPLLKFAYPNCVVPQTQSPNSLTLHEQRAARKENCPDADVLAKNVIITSRARSFCSSNSALQQPRVCIRSCSNFWFGMECLIRISRARLMCRPCVHRPREREK